MGLGRYLLQRVKERFSDTPKWIKKFKWHRKHGQEVILLMKEPKPLTASALAQNESGLVLLVAPVPTTEEVPEIGSFVLRSAVDYCRGHGLDYRGVKVYDSLGKLVFKSSPRHRLINPLRGVQQYDY